MRSHDESEGVDDGVDLLQSAVLSELFQEESGGWGVVDLSGCLAQSDGLQAALDSWVDDGVEQGCALLDGSLEGDQVAFDGVENLLLGGSRVQSAGIATLDAEHLDWWFHQLGGNRRCTEVASLKREFLVSLAAVLIKKLFLGCITLKIITTEWISRISRQQLLLTLGGKATTRSGKCR